MTGIVAIVTGSNQGIGFQTVKNLCKELSQASVYLTSRDVARGEKAVADLQGEGLNPQFYQLDISDQQSIDTFKAHIEQKHGGVDILVNNAGYAYDNNSTAPDAEQAEVTVKINFFGTLAMCRAFFPLLKPHARVVNVSSVCGELKFVSDEDLKAQLRSPDLTEDQLTKWAEHYVNSYKAGDYDPKTEGWPTSKYCMSKVLVHGLTFVQQRTFDRERAGDDIVINAVHPGYVSTNMSNFKGHLTLEQGAKAQTYCALLPKNVEHPKGEYVIDDCSIRAW